MGAMVSVEQLRIEANRTEPSKCRSVATSRLHVECEGARFQNILKVPTRNFVNRVAHINTLVDVFWIMESVVECDMLGLNCTTTQTKCSVLVGWTSTLACAHVIKEPSHTQTR